jgi:hypothetical protein
LQARHDGLQLGRRRWRRKIVLKGLLQEQLVHERLAEHRGVGIVDDRGRKYQPRPLDQLRRCLFTRSAYFLILHPRGQVVAERGWQRVNGLDPLSRHWRLFAPRIPGTEEIVRRVANL